MRGGRVQWWPPSLLPVALAAFHVLRFYVESGVSPFAILRALLVAIVAALALWTVASLALRDSRKGTVLASLLILAFLGGADIAVMVAVGALLVAVIVVLPRALRVAFPWYLVPRAANALALILTLTIAVRGVQNGTLGQLGRDVSWAVSGARVAIARDARSTNIPAAPDVYVLMLEDYPRADTLERLFGFDNTPFLAALVDRGFTVSSKSRANYSNSLLTLVTMFQARHIEAIPELEGVRADPSIDPHRALRDALNEGPTLDIMRGRGYEILAASPGYEQDTLRSADRFFDGGQLNDFELTMIVTTPWPATASPARSWTSSAPSSVSASALNLRFCTTSRASPQPGLGSYSCTSRCPILRSYSGRRASQSACRSTPSSTTWPTSLGSCPSSTRNWGTSTGSSWTPWTTSAEPTGLR